MTETAKKSAGDYQSRIQRKCDEYAESVLRYYRSDSADLPALPDAEIALFDTLQFWLDMRWEIPAEIRDEIAGASIGHAREELAING